MDARSEAKRMSDWYKEHGLDHRVALPSQDDLARCNFQTDDGLACGEPVIMIDLTLGLKLCLAHAAASLTNREG